MAETSFRKIRPFKILAIVMVAIALILTIISLAGPDWVSVRFYGGKEKSWGLWWECLKVHSSFELCVESDWLAACAAMVFISMITDVVATAVGIWGLCAKRRLPYVIAGALCIASIVFKFISLIIYPVKFKDEVTDDQEYRAETSELLFDWTYGIAWGAVCFLIGAAVFFFIRVKEEENQPMKTAYGGAPPAYY